MKEVDFKTTLLFAPLAYAIHHIEEHLLFNFREWRLTYFPNNNPLPTEAVLSIIMAITLLYILYHQIASTKASAEGGIFFLMATQVHNVIYHLGGSIMTLSYSPGTITAILLYVPANLIIIRNAFREDHINRNTCIVLFLLGGLTFWLMEFFGIMLFILGIMLSWFWIFLGPRLFHNNTSNQ